MCCLEFKNVKNRLAETIRVRPHRGTPRPRVHTCVVLRVREFVCVCVCRLYESFVSLPEECASIFQRILVELRAPRKLSFASLPTSYCAAERPCSISVVSGAKRKTQSYKIMACSFPMDPFATELSRCRGTKYAVVQ